MQNPEEEGMSSRFWTTLGYDPDLMPHKASAWQEMINKEDLAKAYELVQRHCKDPSFPYEQIIRYTHKNGSIVWIKCRGIAIRNENGVPVRMLGAHHDITDIKNAELELQKSKSEIEKNENRYKSLLGHLDAGIVVHAPDTTILQCNNKASELLVLSEEQLKGKKAIDLRWQFVDGENQTMSLENFPVNRILSTKEPLKDYIVGVYRLETKDKVWLYVNGFPVFDENNQLEEVVVSFIDFTEKKLADEQLKIAKDKAEEGDRLKTTFLQNMSHEIRTPLNAIVGFSKMLTDSNLSPESKKSFTSIIQNSTNQLLGIVNDILTISAIETKQEKLNLEQIDVNEMLAELLAIFNAQTNYNKVEFKFKPEFENELVIKSDRTKLVQVITNLLTNAKKFTLEGTIEFGYKLFDNEIQFFVKDSGIGIKPEDQEKSSNVLFKRMLL